MSREQAPIDFPREEIQRKAAAAGRVNQSIEHEDREMAVTVKYCENCDFFYYVGSVEKCTYCSRNLVTYLADDKWTKEYFDLDSKARNGDRNAERLKSSVGKRFNREIKKGQQEGRHKEQMKSQENINETLKKLLETVENMDMTAATEDVADETLVCDDSSSVSFFIDDGGGCPSPMTSSGSSYFARPPAASGRQLCYPDRNMECAAGFTAVLGPLVTQIPYCYE